jgi:hypothetical protein
MHILEDTTSIEYSWTSRINLIYRKTLRAMHISMEFLKKRDCSFHGIITGSTNIHWVE